MTTVAAPICERPILFSGEMVRAILDERKTQTRRVIKHPRNPLSPHSMLGFGYWPESQPGVATLCGPDYPDGGDDNVRCPYGVPGDRLWVRESALYLKPIAGDDSIADVMYADHEDFDICRPDKTSKIDLGWRMRPSIHMPRWASRIALEVTRVRVERVQEITIADARAEGITEYGEGFGKEGDDVWRNRTSVENFAERWNALNAKRGFGWNVNPWVWVLDFRRVA